MLSLEEVLSAEKRTGLTRRAFVKEISLVGMALSFFQKLALADERIVKLSNGETVRYVTSSNSRGIIWMSPDNASGRRFANDFTHFNYAVFKNGKEVANHHLPIPSILRDSGYRHSPIVGSYGEYPKVIPQVLRDVPMALPRYIQARIHLARRDCVVRLANSNRVVSAEVYEEVASVPKPPPRYAVTRKGASGVPRGPKGVIYLEKEVPAVRGTSTYSLETSVARTVLRGGALFLATDYMVGYIAPGWTPIVKEIPLVGDVVRTGEEIGGQFLYVGSEITRGAVENIGNMVGGFINVMAGFVPR